MRIKWDLKILLNKWEKKKRVRGRKEKTWEKETENKKEESAKNERKGIVEIEKECEKISVFARSSEVRKALLLKQPILVLMYKENCFNTNELPKSIPSSVVSLLQDFKDIFPEGVPSGLPPLCGIEQQIEFVPELRPRID